MHNISPQVLVASQSISAGGQSAGWALRQMYGFCVQAVVSSASGLTATLKLQGSNDGTNWTDVASSSQSVSANGTFVWNYVGAFYDQVRLAWTVSGGSCTLAATITAKGMT